MTEPRRAERWVLTGRVQGVGFRFFTRREAEALGLVGWVRNRPDAAVELVVEGAEDALSRFETLLRQGPPASDVRELTREPAASPEETGFVIRR